MRESLNSADTEEPDNDPEAEEDEERWQRKALNALKAGKSANVTFESKHIDAVRVADIAHDFEHATTDQEVRAVFAAKPFWWERYP